MKKEIINYLIFGVLTTLVSVLSYRLFTLLNINYLISTVLSWVVAVTFAYITNRKFVFVSCNKNLFKEIVMFFTSRLFSLLVEVLFMFILVDLIHFNDLLSKILCQGIVIVLNYILSKLLVFKR